LAGGTGHRADAQPDPAGHGRRAGAGGWAGASGPAPFAEGEQVRYDAPQPEVLEPVRPQAMSLKVVFEDEHLMVIDKPAGLVVHPAPGHADGTLVNALLAHV